MEKRHKEWVMIWNANCDSARPRTKRELLQDLDTWERTQGGHALVSSASVYQGAQIKDKEFDGAGWSTRHNDAFNDLIAQARMSTKTTAQQSRKPSSSAGNANKIGPSCVNGTGGDEVPIALESSDEVNPVQTPVENSRTIDLTSPVKLDESRKDSISLPNDEHTNIDTVVSPTLAETLT